MSSRRRARHRELADRFRAPLRPRRELLEALWQAAVHQTGRRRRKARTALTPIADVPVWCELSQGHLISEYRRYTKHLRDLGEGLVVGPAATMSTRTLTRQIIAARALRLVAVTRQPFYDTKRKEWVQWPNVYEFTERGKLWIKQHAWAVKVPKVL